MKKQIIYSAALIFVLSSCTKNIDEFNKNPKQPESVPAAMLFANAQKDLVYWASSTNVNDNTLRLWAQHWTETTYTDEANYELTERNVNGRTYNRLYTGVLRDLSEARRQMDLDELISDADKKVQLAMIDVLECYTYAALVDIFNDVPYSEAGLLLDNLAPAYDNAQDIYTDLIARLKADAADLNSGGSSGDLGSSDNMYGGDAANWVAFANSIRLKLALRTDDLAEAEDAVSAGVFTSSAQDAILYFEASPPNTNPLWEDLVQSGRYDFIASGTLADMMTSTNDPRMFTYFKNLYYDSTLSQYTVVGPPHGEGSAFNNNSQPGDQLEDPTHAGQLMTYYEVEFLKAHLEALKSGDVESHYNTAITESILYWGGTQAEADAFLQYEVNYDSLLNIEGQSWQEIIGTQKWVAMYDNGLEAWTTWRLYDYPAMQEAAEAGTVPPTRWNYSVDEYSVNSTNVSAANGGKDATTDKVFWDTK